MYEPYLLHHLTLNPYWWLLCLAISMSICSWIAYKYYKQTSLFWKKVDLAWILFAVLGAIPIVIESNKNISNNFMQAGVGSFESKVKMLITSKSENTYYCKDHSYKPSVCRYLDELMAPIIVLAEKHLHIPADNVIPPKPVANKLTARDLQKMQEIYQGISRDVKDYNERLDIVQKWKELKNSADINIPILSYIGTLLFIFAFSLRIGKSVADIRAESDKLEQERQSK